MDYDGDGRKDVLSGSWPGELYLFRQQDDGAFADGATLKDKDDKPLNAGNASTVFATDWDADGDLDLVLGNISGEVHVATNEGSRTEPSYGKPQKLDISSQLGSRGGDSGPIVADWDGDGLGDLLIGMGEGSVVWFRNAGTKSEPKFAESEELVTKSAFGFDFEKRKPGDWGARVKVHVTDWNGDGRADLLLGDRSGSPAPKEVQLTDAQKQEIEAAKEKLVEIRADRTRRLREIQKLQRAAEKGKDDEARSDLEAAQAEFEKLDEQYAELSNVSRQATPQPQRHGFVWVFLRKPAVN